MRVRSGVTLALRKINSTINSDAFIFYFPKQIKPYAKQYTLAQSDWAVTQITDQVRCWARLLGLIAILPVTVLAFYCTSHLAPAYWMPGALLNTLSPLATFSKSDHSYVMDGKTEAERSTGRAASLHNFWHSGSDPGAGQCATCTVCW